MIDDLANAPQRQPLLDQLIRVVAWIYMLVSFISLIYYITH